ncbi:hypothetical protein HDV04_002826 [Boothiomyces sp. JEL0838]|nr:hypothetical protein HDV04_002826 [Boothiomyces sp. JEL0838]
MNSEINSDVDLSYAVESFTDGDSHANYEDRRWENGQSFLSQEEVVIVEEEEYNRDSSVLEYSYNESNENVDQPEQNPESTNAMHEQENSYSEVSNKAIEDNNEQVYSESSYNSEENDQIQEFPKMHQIDSGFVVTPTAHSAEMSFVEPAEVGHVMSLPRRKEARWSSQFEEEIPVQGIANEVKVPSPRSVAIEYPAPTQIETQRAISPISENRETSVESAQPLTKKDNLDLDLSEEKKKRFMYGCIPVNKKSRYPEFHVTAINVKNGTHFNFTEVNLNANNLDFKFSLDMILDVVVLNHNLYHLKVDSIDLTAYIWANASEINNAGVLPTQEVFGKVNKTRITVDSSNRQQEIGHGIYSQQQTFLPGVNSTFHIPLRVEYSPNPEYGALNDPALNEILQLCQTERIPTRHTTIHYEAYNDISLLKMFGLTPNLRGEISINCPFQGEDYSAFLQAIGKGSH